ncbi:DUF2610 domain-containing protein [Rhizobium sp. SL86]|uniref:DUF2610 domain-containing protein n=1 Tax=Rhizobium sp. SL86 TaxID=2995148 RepID=UPI002275B690|nr:DUF2610 domain-containing protein [Rhizobium sp. SL86]MCY1669026.1 DUF2610 domain-containing protein [Rhizobium sp. SL86]
MTRIFVSHSSLDNAAAAAIDGWLRKAGWDDVFVDFHPERGIAAGERWEEALTKAANRCEAVIFLVSRNWLGSEWCTREFDLARRLSKRLFGVLIDDITLEAIPLRFKETWQFTDLNAGEDHEIFPVTVPPDGRQAHVTFSRGGLTRLRAGLVKAGLDPRFFEWPPAEQPDRSPYRGLAPLDGVDAGIFFGREAPLVQAMDALRALSERAAPRLFVIQGASGAGKSSFLRAGLLPRLARQDRIFCPLPVIRPARAALTGDTGLAESLLKALELAGMPEKRAAIRDLVDDPEAVAARLAAIAANRRVPTMPGEAEARQPVIVIPVDQAEELFLADGGAEAARFLELLRHLTEIDQVTMERAEPLRAIVLFTIRTDSYGSLQSAPALSGLSQSVFSLAPMPKGAFETVIEGPARRLNAAGGKPLRIEPALTAALLADIEHGGGNDTLPLLAFTLQRLFAEQGGDGNLSLAEYEASGRLAGAIEAAVAYAFAACDGDPAVPRDHAARIALLRRGLIPWLAGIDPETRQPRRKVARLSEIPEEARPLIRHLIDARLLSTDQAPGADEPTIEPAHESLLRQWAALAGWLQEDQAHLAALEGVLSATRDWLANDKRSDWLAHTAGRLEDAENLLLRPDMLDETSGEDDRRRAQIGLKLGREERAYLAACRAADDARRDRELEDARRIVEEANRRAEAERSRSRAQRIGLAVATILLVMASGSGIHALRTGWALEERNTELAVVNGELAGANTALESANVELAHTNTELTQTLGTLERTNTKLAAAVRISELRLATARGIIDQVLREISSADMYEVWGFDKINNRIVSQLGKAQVDLAAGDSAVDARVLALAELRQAEIVAENDNVLADLALYESAYQRIRPLVLVSQPRPDDIRLFARASYRYHQALSLIGDPRQTQVVADILNVLSDPLLPLLENFSSTDVTWISWSLDSARRDAQNRGDLRLALEISARSIEVAEAAVSKAPQGTAAVVDLNTLRQNYALILTLLGRAEEARKINDEACDFFIGSLVEYEGNRQFRLQTLSCLFDRSKAARDSGNRDHSLDLLSQATEIAESVTDVDSTGTFSNAIAKILYERHFIARYVDKDIKAALDYARRSTDAYLTGIERASTANSFDHSGDAAGDVVNLLLELEVAGDSSVSAAQVTAEILDLHRRLMVCANVLGGGANCGAGARTASLSGGKRLLKDGRTAEAVAILRDAVKLSEGRVADPYYLRFSEPIQQLCEARRELSRALIADSQVDAAIALLDENISYCRTAYLERFPDDFYVRSAWFGSVALRASAFVALGRLEDARGAYRDCVAIYHSGCYAPYAEMLENGAGGPIAMDEAERVRALTANTQIKRFTVPVAAPGSSVTFPFHVYIFNRPPGWPWRGIEDQAEWLRRERDLVVPQDVRDSFIKLENIAEKNNVSFPDLAIYALGTAQDKDTAKDAKGAKE